VPLHRRDGSHFGTLCALDPRPAALDEAHLEIFHLLADLIAFELEAEEEQRRRAGAEAERRTFVDALAHDLKNPLQAVKTHAQLLRRRLGSGRAGPEDLERGLAGIETAAARTFGLIDEMLDAAHLQTGQPLKLRTAPTDLVALANACAGDQQRTTSRHRLRVETSLAALIAEVDGSRLERVVNNLVANAIRYSPDGGEVTIRVGIVEEEGRRWAELAVADQGVGIPAADRGRIFEPFRRGANVEGKIRGTGLGLAGARQIVEQHGGSITVDSTEGAGSTFVVRLPVTPSASPSRVAPGSARSDAGERYDGPPSSIAAAGAAGGSSP